MSTEMIVFFYYILLLEEITLICFQVLNFSWIPKTYPIDYDFLVIYILMNSLGYILRFVNIGP